MEHLGRVTEWRVDRGFGFVTPLRDDAVRVFFHIRDYQQAGRRPELGELVKYTAKADGGRWKATSVARAVRRREQAAPVAAGKARRRRTPVSIPYALVAGYFVGVAWVVGEGRLPVWFLFVALGSSAIVYTAYAIDKHAAAKGNRRIPEATLHLLELLSGWPGALLAQTRLRHKTAKRSYRIEFWLATLANLAATGIWIARS